MVSHDLGHNNQELPSAIITGNILWGLELVIKGSHVRKQLCEWNFFLTWDMDLQMVTGLWPHLWGICIVSITSKGQTLAGCHRDLRKQSCGLSSVSILCLEGPGEILIFPSHNEIIISFWWDTLEGHVHPWGHHRTWKNWQSRFNRVDT